MDAEDVAKFAAARNGCKNSLEELMLANKNLVYKIVNRFGNVDEEEDLMQLGWMGLMAAIKGFDPELGFKFSTYAGHKIVSSIRHYLRDEGALEKIKLPREIKELSNHIRKKMDIDGTTLNHHIQELDDFTKSGVLMFFKRHLSLQGKVITSHDDNENVTLSDTIGNLEDYDLQTTMVEIKKLLTKREIEVLKLEMEDLHQREIADIVGLSQVQVSRTIAIIREKLAPYFGITIETPEQKYNRCKMVVENYVRTTTLSFHEISRRVKRSTQFVTDVVKNLEHQNIDYPKRKTSNNKRII